jgi:hypothetical protein
LVNHFATPLGPEMMPSLRPRRFEVEIFLPAVLV